MDFSKVCVFLDNGHGNNTPGKCSPDKSIKEYSYVREIVQMLDKALREMGIKTFIVVPELKDISLTERVKRINSKYNYYKKQGISSFVISVHLNAAGNGSNWTKASGWTVWVAKKASKNSRLLAQMLYNEAYNRKLKGNRCVPKDRFWTADFYIVAKTLCPAVLTENMFQDNKEDVKWLLTKEGKKTITEIHVEGIKKFIEKL